MYLHWLRELSPAVEFYGGIGFIDDSEPLKQQQHIFPLFWVNCPRASNIAWVRDLVSTPGSDRVLVKLNFGLERFVGEPFTP